MEPIASQANVPLLRPAGVVAAEAQAVLREGRVLSGEVLARLDGGTLLLGLGGLRVPAETAAELRPGDRFRAVVERRDGELALRLLPEERATSERGLVGAVRALLAEGRGVDAALRELAAAVRAEGAGAGEGERRVELEGLLRALEGQRFAPGMDGEALAALLDRGGRGFVQALVAAAASVGADSFDAAVRSLAGELLAALRAAGFAAAGGDRALLEGGLAAALRALAGERLEGGLSREQLAGLGERVQRALAAALRGRGEAGARLAAALEAGATSVARQPGLLRALLAVPGALGPSALASSAADAALAGLGRGLRGQLVLWLAGLEDGPLRESASRALAALDLEQLLNVARREFGEPLHFALPVPDGAGWSTAELFVLEREARGGAPDDGDGSWRVVLGVDLSRLGPIRADLYLRDRHLAVRLRVARPATAQRLRRAARALEEALAAEGHDVRLAVLEAPPEEVSVEPLARDIRLLREHHLMDVRG